MEGVVILFPLVGDIPGVPTIMAIFVMLVAGQLLFRNEHLWLPHWLLARSVPMDKLEKGAAWMRRPLFDLWIADDGLLMLLALAISGATFILGGYGLF